MAAQMPAQLVHSLPAAPECDDPAFLVREIGGGAFYFLSYGDGTEFVVDAKGERVWGNCPLPLTIETWRHTFSAGHGLRIAEARHYSAPCKRCVPGRCAVAISGGAGAENRPQQPRGAARRTAICEDIAQLPKTEAVYLYSRDIRACAYGRTQWKNCWVTKKRCRI